MTREEFGKLILGVKAIYTDPKFIPDKYSIAVWYDFFKDYKADDIRRAFKAYIAKDDFGKAPVPGQIRALIPLDEELLEAEEAWNLVYTAISNSGYHSEREFAKLPPICQKAMVSANNLRNLSQEDAETTQSVQKALFIKRYKTIREEEIYNKQMMKGNNQNGIGADRDRKALADEKEAILGTAK